jgi:hypothetical protein
VSSGRYTPMAEHATIGTATEEQCFLCGRCLNVVSRTISGANAVQGREVKSWSVSLLEALSGGMGIVREPRVRGTSAVGSRYWTTTGEDTADWKDLVRVVVNFRVCKSAIALYLLVVMICKLSVNAVTNSKPVYSHLCKWQYSCTK